MSAGDHKDVAEVGRRARRAAHRLTRWRALFAGWQLGTRPATDGPTRAVRDHREVTMLMRAELNAVSRILLDRGVVSEVELTEAFAEEYEQLDAAFAERFPGVVATDEGLTYTVPLAADTMRREGFPP